MTTLTPADPDLAALPALALDDAGHPATFAAPWEAQVFAMALSLHERGVFTWPEWSRALARQLADAASRGEPDDGTHYYEHWLAALERLVAEKKVVGEDELELRVDEWDAAARATPHGKPIELGIQRLEQSSPVARSESS
jgi:nitrile hydratase accessory protein